MSEETPKLRTNWEDLDRPARQAPTHPSIIQNDSLHGGLDLINTNNVII
jgi:hypothetical protein